MDWPNDHSWLALADGEVVFKGGEPIGLRVVDCGELLAPAGSLLVCDPYNSQLFWSESFEFEERLREDWQMPLLAIPPGRYPVKVTIADVGGKLDRLHERNAYLTLFLADAAEVRRESLAIYRAFGGRHGIGVDVGMICLVDYGVLTPHLLEAIERDEVPYWTDCLDEDDLPYGIANLDLPWLIGYANMILVYSGWGDGLYLVVGCYDAGGDLVRVHVDFALWTHWASPWTDTDEDDYDESDKPGPGDDR